MWKHGRYLISGTDTKVTSFHTGFNFLNVKTKLEILISITHQVNRAGESSRQIVVVSGVVNVHGIPA